MHFIDRKQAGRMLAKALKPYQGKDIIVYALPRGGVVLGFEVAKFLPAPLALIITRKIGSPNNAEYAIGAISESGDIIGDFKKLSEVDIYWLKTEIRKQYLEARRRRAMYNGSRKPVSAKGKIAILVDDGIATGLTMRAAIKEIKHQAPQKIVVAIPVVPYSSLEILRSEVDEVIAVYIPSDAAYQGSVGAYYEYFPQVSDQEVLYLLKKSKSETSLSKKNWR